MAFWALPIFGLLLAKDAWHTHELKKIDKQYTYTLPNGVVYYMDGSIARRLDNDRRLYWYRGEKLNNNDPTTMVVYWDDMKTVVYDAEEWAESHVDRSSYKRFRAKVNARVFADQKMIYDEKYHHFIALVKKIYIKETNQYFYKAYKHYDPNWEAVLRQGGDPNGDKHLCIQVDYYSTDYDDHGYIIKKEDLEELLSLIENIGLVSVRKATKVYDTIDYYKEWEWQFRSEDYDIIPKDAELVDRI